MSRRISIDLDISRIPSTELEILEVPKPEGEVNKRFWVPVSRHRRSDLAPVSVVDPTGSQLPRMSYRGSLALIAAGILRIFRMLLDNEREVAGSSSALDRALKLGNRSVWCLERAILEFIHVGGPGGYRDLRELSDRFEKQAAADDKTTAQISAWRSRQKLDHESERVRERAIAILDELFPQPDDPFLDLLDLAAQDYFLVIATPANPALTSVSYEAPLLKAEEPPTNLSQQLRLRLAANLPRGRDYSFEYSTMIAPHLRSFHLSLEVDSDVKINNLVLVTDEDHGELNAIVAGLKATADAIERAGIKPEAIQSANFQDYGQGKVMEHELQSLLSRIRLLLRSRLREASTLSSPVETDSDARPTRPGSPWTGLEYSLRRLIVTARLNAVGDIPHLRETTEYGDAGNLRKLADVLLKLELDRGVVGDNDPRENGAHVGWTRLYWPIPRAGSSRSGITARAKVLLTDDRPALGDSVRWMVLALTILVWLAGFAATARALWFLLFNNLEDTASFSQADALVAILLLVPGLLIARLHLPEPRTVLGELRGFARRIAVAAVAITTALAVVIAVTSPAEPLWVMRLALLILIVLTAAAQLDIQFRRAKARRHDISLEGLPKWLSILHGAQVESIRRPDVVFRALTVEQRDGADGKR